VRLTNRSTPGIRAAQPGASMLFMDSQADDARGRGMTSRQQLPLAAAVALLASSLIALIADAGFYLSDRSAGKGLRSVALALGKSREQAVTLGKRWEHDNLGRGFVSLGLAGVLAVGGGYLVWRLWRSRSRHDFGVTLGLVATVVVGPVIFAATYGAGKLFFPR